MQPPGALIDFTYGWLYADQGYETVNTSFRANAKGPLTAYAGLGPDGTPGHLIVSQTGFNRTTYMVATADWFPAEFVEVRATAK
jgi:hypothetical protein